MNRYFKFFLYCFLRVELIKKGIKEKFLFFILLITFAFSIVYDGQAQFINIEINIEPQVNATVEQSLDFGEAISGSGMIEIQMGSPQMGIFQIRALRAQRILLSIEIDEDLIHENPNIDARIPMNLSAGYTNDGVNDVRQSLPFDSELQTVIVNPPPQTPNAMWSSIFVYVYGSLDIRNIPIGTYDGQVLLTIVYE